MLLNVLSVLGIPVLIWALWSTTRLARVNRRGTAGMDVAEYGLLPREVLDPTRGGPPVPYELVIHEAALRIMVGDRAASRAQLSRLLDLSEADHITIRVVPFELEGFTRAGYSMTYVGGPVPKLDTVVRDVPHGSAFIDSEVMLGVFRTRFRKIEEVALPPDRSRPFIGRCRGSSRRHCLRRTGSVEAGCGRLAAVLDR